MCVSEDKVRQIVHEENEHMSDNLRSIRTWAIGLLTTLLFGLFGMGVWVGTIENQVESVTSNQENFEDKVEAKLTRIEDLLLQLTREVNK